MKAKTTVVIIMFLLLLQASAAYCGLRIAVYSDSQASISTYQTIVDGVLTYNPDIVLHAGDIVNSSASDWDIFNEITAPILASCYFYPAAGNHDHSVGIELFRDNFDLPNNEQWYSVEHENVHIIILDSDEYLFEDSAQYVWLEDDLQDRGDQIKFTIVVFHKPIFSSIKTASSTFRESAIQLFEQYGVDIVFNGHAHSYERSFCNGIYYIVTAGAGAGLYSPSITNEYSQKYIKIHHFCMLYVDNNQILVDVVDKDLNIIDQFSIGAGTLPYGDVSGNGRITAYDASMVGRHAAELITLDSAALEIADVNGDGIISAADAALIARKAAGLIDKFPVEDL
ncbi:MAG: metallophosphoesterase [Candidatus Omnitrophica bacterium]|nr:metallophosphoesterase [Candidatus Omnitrophota bacterium]